MRNSRKLALRRETLTPLTTDEMTSVAGGSHACGITDGCGHGPSIDETCPSVPVTPCTSIIDFSNIRTVC